MYFYIIAIFSVILDWTSKVFMKSFLDDKSISLIGDKLILKLTQNTGIAFSFPIEGMVLKILTLLLIGFILFYYFKYENRKDILKNIIFGLIIGGSLGNGFERIFYGKVTDFISVKYFAIFNFADIFINIGIILLIYVFLKNEYGRK